MAITEQAVYRLLRTVPRGKVTTYKALAAYFHSKAYRLIGQIMKKNPDAPGTPCHRVVASDGTLGGYMGHTSGETLRKKIRLLTDEGVRIRGKRVVDFADHLITF